ncbi:MAG: hypothetical protein QNK37_31365 [Acidobacteriota bacterium]|nr:hypothetical protein [Acidobacteriota bacterium]
MNVIIPQWTSALGVLIAGALLVPILIILRKLLVEASDFTVSFQGLSNKIPKKDLVRNITDSSRALTNALEEERKMLAALPTLISERVASEITNGINPLSLSIERSASVTNKQVHQLTVAFRESHEHFHQLLLTVSDEGHFREWIGAFRETVAPLETATRAIENNYSTAESLLKETTRFVSQWAGHWEKVEGNFNRFSNEFSRWSAAETTHAKDIEHRIMNRLEEVSETRHQINKSLNELQSARTKLMDSNRELSNSVSSMSRRMNELCTLNENLQARQHELFEQQTNFQTGFNEWQMEIQTRGRNTQTQLANFLTQTEQAVNGMLSRIEEALDRLTRGYQQLHKQREEQLNNLITRMSAANQSQAQILKRQEQLISRVDRAFKHMPNRPLQISGFVIQSLIFLVLVFIAFKGGF